MAKPRAQSSRECDPSRRKPHRATTSDSRQHARRLGCLVDTVADDAFAVSCDSVESVGVDDVAARAAGDHVALPVVGTQDIIARATRESISTRPADEQVVAAEAIEHVVPAQAAERVSARRSAEDITSACSRSDRDRRGRREG